MATSRCCPAGDIPSSVVLLIVTDVSSSLQTRLVKRVSRDVASCVARRRYSRRAFQLSVVSKPMEGQKPPFQMSVISKPMEGPEPTVSNVRHLEAHGRAKPHRSKCVMPVLSRGRRRRTVFPLDTRVGLFVGFARRAGGCC